ncbi:MAG: hypothetical protein CM1200mP29_05010 [Verrucomicrobiota bacterium]|nr:MAG: hypothetical protein CM1200mP29_05010 [Verrucomicrobiota bacterium]
MPYSPLGSRWAVPICMLRKPKPHIVLLSGESLYGSATTLPRFAKRLGQEHGYRCTVIVRKEEHRFPASTRLSKRIS